MLNYVKRNYEKPILPVQKQKCTTSIKTKSRMGITQDTITFKNNKSKNLNFKGRQYPSGYYNDRDIAVARLYLRNPDPDWKNQVYTLGTHIFYEYEAGKVAKNFVTSLFTFGLVDKQMEDQKKAGEEYQRKIVRLRADMLAQEGKEEKEALRIQGLEEKFRLKNASKMTNIKEQYLRPLYSLEIEKERAGKPASIPNCLMIDRLYPETSLELIDWISKNTDCKFVKIKHTDDLLQALKDAETHYKETASKNTEGRGQRSLIHVDKMEDLINPHITNEDEIGDLKRFMQQCSKKYHSTLIFDTEDPSRLDHIALQPHRVKTIPAKIKDVSQSILENRVKRIQDVTSIVCPFVQTTFLKLTS